MRYNIIALRDAPRDLEATTVLHEYVHFLVRNHGSLLYPKWFDEGFAEYLGNARIRGQHFEIGVAPEDRLRYLGRSTWIPMRQIIQANAYEHWSPERKTNFYAEAWALVHYLVQPERERSFADAIAQYTTLVEGGTEDLEAFEQSFGMSATKVDREVSRYLTRGRIRAFRAEAEQLVPTFETKEIRLTREEAALALGDLAFFSAEPDKAERFYSVAAESGATRPRGEAGLGSVLQFRNEFEAAETHFARAVELAPNDPLCRLDLAEFWHERYEKFGLPEHLRLARTEYAKAWQLDDSMPEVYAMLGHTYVLEGERYDRAIEMLEGAKNLLPSHLWVRLWLAQAYEGAGYAEQSENEARFVTAWSHEDSEPAQHARELLDRLAE
jgi:tetratricopeptide (TPR) repeat protein